MAHSARKIEKYTVEHLKKGRRLYGGFYVFEDGRKIYLAYRKYGDIYRGGKSSISEAMRDGVASWAIDTETVMEVRARGIKAIGVIIRDTGEIYLARLSDFLDSDKARVMNYAKRGGSMQRYLPLEYFRKKEGIIKL